MRPCLLLFAALALAVVSTQPVFPQEIASAPQPCVTLIRATPAYYVFMVTFPSPVQNAVPPNPIVFVEYYVPSCPGRNPAVILLPHWGVVKPYVERELAENLASNGIATAIMVPPYHLQRTPRGFKSGTAMISSDIPRLVRSVHQAVLEVNKLIHWLECRPEVDPQKIGITGISLGAMLAALALGQIDQVSAAAFILAGGNVADVLWTSPIMYKVRRGLRAEGYTEQRLACELAPVEPLNFVKPEQGKEVYMVNGLYDFVIPRRDVLALWNALGRPQITWIESGHFIVGWTRRKIDRLVTEFFLYRFGMRGSFHPPAIVREPRIKLGLLFDEYPIVGLGGAVSVYKPRNSVFTLDLNVTTGGISLGAGADVNNYLTIGLQRKFFSPRKGLLPYAMLHILL